MAKRKKSGCKNSTKQKIYCCGCQSKVMASLTNGAEIYRHRPDLKNIPFWQCGGCMNFVGCHHKTKDRTRPLGVIPTPEIRNARRHIHKLIDPLWQTGKIDRNALYAKFTEEVGWKFHVAKIRSVEEARSVYRVALTLKADLG